MNIFRLVRRTAAPLLLACTLACAMAPANANMVDIGAGDYHDSVFVNSANMDVTDFHADASGTVTVKLADIGWVSLLNSLSTYVSSAGQTFFTSTKEGTFTFNVNAGENFCAGIYAIANGTARYGLYTFDMHFTPSQITPVPVPAAGWLLISGLSLVPALRRRRQVDSAISV